MPKSEILDDLITELCMQADADGCEVLVVWTDGGEGSGYSLGGCGGFLSDLLVKTRLAISRLAELANSAAAARSKP